MSRLTTAQGATAESCGSAQRSTQPTEPEKVERFCIMLVRKTRCGSPVTLGCRCCETGIAALEALAEHEAGQASLAEHITETERDDCEQWGSSRDE